MLSSDCKSSLNFILRWDFFSWTCGEYYQVFFLHLLTWSHNFSPLFFDVVNYIDWFFDTLPNCITLLGHYVLSSLYTAICLNLFRIIPLMFMRFVGSIVLFFVLPLSSFGMKAFLDSQNWMGKCSLFLFSERVLILVLFLI